MYRTTGNVRSFAPFVVAIVVTLLPAGLAAAQDCGNWRYPVLCTAELVATDMNRQSVSLSQRSRIELAPREYFDLEVIGRDQRGRYFPSDRLVVGYESRDCRSLIDVDDRGRGLLRVGARAAQGRCRLVIWIPGNLNFEWELDFEVSPAARSGYTRSEAQFIVNALYQAILARDPDPPSFGPTVAEVQAGNLEGVVAAMFNSAEFRETATGVDATALLERFYRGILGRESDSGGVRTYMGEMRRGQYVSVLLKLIRSSEFERRLPR